MSDPERNSLIAELHRSGATRAQLADRFSLSPQRVGRILENQRRDSPDGSKGCRCPHCGRNSRTLETRARRAYVYRRHECLGCMHRWTSRQSNTASRNTTYSADCRE